MKCGKLGSDRRRIHPHVGTWEITLNGLHASEYRLSQNRVEVLEGETIAVSVTRVDRVPDKIANVPIANPIASDPTATASANPTTPLSDNSTETNRIVRGLLPQPSDRGFDWQMQLIRHVGISNPFYTRLAIVGNDPLGKLVAWSNGNDVVVVSTESERVEQFIAAPTIDVDTVVPWNSVKFSPKGDRLALCSLHGHEIQIRSNGRFKGPAY